MWLFYILISIIVSFNLYPNKNKYTIYIFTIFTILAMFKSSGVGNDTAAYINLYNSVSDRLLLIMSGRFEPGLVIICKALNLISPNPQILFIVCGLYSFLCFGYLICRFSPLPWVSALMFFCLYFDQALSGLRQTMATATICISFFYIIKRKPIRHLCLVLVASLFHISALSFLVAYPLSLMSRYNEKLKFYLFSIVFLSVISLSPLLNLAIKIFPRFQYYVGGTYMDGEIRAASVLMFFVLTSVYLFSYYLDVTHRSKIDNKISSKLSPLTDRGYNALSNLSMVACLVVLLSFKATILSRFSDILGFFSIIYYPNMLALIHKRSIRFEWNVIFLGIVIIYICVVHFVRPEWSSTYPYTFFWQ